ncbi:MAG: hypothetical protein JRI23_07130 [Deltaproteobacteria bacterium]|jgi:hypothetical protein|nr:hypothetical protein [Deltaproteobacteria bacterium]MBW2531365.1 hypothetical protein [Deltaproteobacteria bacterium]
MKGMYWLVGLFASAALLGCPQQSDGGDDGKAGASCKSDSDCKNGFLCEAKTCVHESVAKKARGAGTAAAKSTAETETVSGVKPGDGKPAATAEATAAPDKPTCGDPKTVPDIPSERSDPPQGAEWDSACQINTQGANASPPNCNMRILRDWLMVTCRGDVLGFEKMENFGNEGFDYFKQIVPGQMASFSIHLSKGTSQKIRICRKKDRASLFVSWPPSQGKPLHVALGTGPVCDGGSWGSAHKK